MHSRTAVLAAMLAIGPLGAKAADLVVWWEQGFYRQEDEAVRELFATFQSETGKQVKLVQPTQDEMLEQAPGGARGRAAPDFLYGRFTSLISVCARAFSPYVEP